MRLPSISADKEESTVLREQVVDSRTRVIGRSTIRAFIDAIPEVRDRQLVSHPQPTDCYPFTVDLDAIRATQVANDDLAVLLCQAAMATRKPERIAACVTRWVPSHHDHVLVDQNVWAPVEGQESR